MHIDLNEATVETRQNRLQYFAQMPARNSFIPELVVQYDKLLLGTKALIFSSYSSIKTLFMDTAVNKVFPFIPQSFLHFPNDRPNHLLTQYIVKTCLQTVCHSLFCAYKCDSLLININNMIAAIM